MSDHIVHQNKILWWIITALLGITMGAGSSWITRLDGMYQLKAEVQYIGRKMDDLSQQVKDLKGKP